MKSNKSGFSLVELIVVIVILSILATVSFLTYSKQSGAARDAKRMASIEIISKGLGVHSSYASKYPEPDNSIKIYSGGTTDNDLIGYMGYAGISVNNIIRTPKENEYSDPVDGTFYLYAMSPLQNRYQLLVFLEDLSVVLSHNFTGNIANAFEYKGRRPYVKGNQIGFIMSGSGIKSDIMNYSYTPAQDINTYKTNGINVSDPIIQSDTSLFLIKDNTFSTYPINEDNLRGYTHRF